MHHAPATALGIFALSALLLLADCSPAVAAEEATPDQQWVVFPGGEGPGKGKHIVFVTGDDEYFSEEGMPMMARILADRHGFKCTVLFAINKETGVIDPPTKDNIPGLQNLDTADLMVIYTRYRELPDDQMQHIINYVESGGPIVAARTATHAFDYKKGSASPLKKYSRNSTEKGFEGGFGRLVLGETWINHHGQHGKESTRGIIAPGMEGHPILRGIKSGEIWGPTDVYGLRLPLPGDSKPLVLGEVLTGMKPNDPPVAGKKNDPMMPIAWIKTYTGASGKPARIFTTTMGGVMNGVRDLDNEALRRLMVNATYWALGLEDKIPAKTNVDIVGKNPFKRGVKPRDVQP